MSTLILHHFTSNVFLPRIEKEGLTKGAVPWALTKEGKVTMMTGLQWLTVDGDFFDQSWDDGLGMTGAIMRKTDWRLTIEIPNLAEFALVPWLKFAEHHNLPVLQHYKERGFTGQKHWWVFRGKIPRSWFAGRIKNPTHRQLVDFDAN